MTPATVHYGQAKNVQIGRQRILHTAFDEYPERFVAGLPWPPSLQDEVWINKPNEDGLTTQNLH
jgi:putative transposase